MSQLQQLQNLYCSENRNDVISWMAENWFCERRYVQFSSICWRRTIIFWIVLW